MKIVKFKILHTLSDGSIYFAYKADSNLNNFNVFRKDNKNFILNIKKNKIKTSFKMCTSYKKVYLKK